MTTVAMFDLDETLVYNDTSAAWGSWSVEKKMIEDDGYLSKEIRFYEDYQTGCLDIFSYTEHCLTTVKGRTPYEVRGEVDMFINELVRDKVYSEAWSILEEHKKKGHHLLLISATGSHIVHPAGEMLGVDTSIGCDLEIIDGVYSGKITGIPSFREGKVKRFRQWAQGSGIKIQETWFYSDSPNDLPLLEYVDNPVATNPVRALETIAIERKWPILRWNRPEPRFA